MTTAPRADVKFPVRDDITLRGRLHRPAGGRPSAIVRAIARAAAVARVAEHL